MTSRVPTSVLKRTRSHALSHQHHVDTTTAATEPKRVKVIQRSVSDINPYSKGDQSWPDGKLRCWSTNQMIDYHDNVWGHPCIDARRLFAHVTYQSFQSGLSWQIVFGKMGVFERVFHQFDYHTIAGWDHESKLQELMQTDGLIKNKLKLSAVLHNARIAVHLDETYRFGFVGYMWSLTRDIQERERLLVSGQHLNNHMRIHNRAAKDILEADGVHPSQICQHVVDTMKATGFKFIGCTTALCLLQAAGLVNHHSRQCFSFQKAEALYHIQREHINAIMDASSSSD